jgi:hypothetical protein
MSSTFVADTTDDHKSDNTLIIIVNNDGTVSVDQETLQNLIGKCVFIVIEFYICMCVFNMTKNIFSNTVMWYPLSVGHNLMKGGNDDVRCRVLKRREHVGLKKWFW